MESDSEHLEKFRKAINTDRPIFYYKVTQGYKIGAGYCRLMVFDSNFANNLINHGCVEHKSNIIKAPTGIPKELEKHFIRGFVDANGSIAKHGKNSYCIKITSTDDVLSWIMNHLINKKILEHKYKFYKRKPDQKVSNFEFGGNYLVKKFLDYIYKDATVWLDRKYERYLNLTDILNKREEEKSTIHSCAVCGESNSVTLCKLDGEYNNIYLCHKHYLQVYKHGKIIPDKKDCCDICGDMAGHMTHVGKKYPEYWGLTLCKKHYTQLNNYGKITDSSIGWHKD